MDEPMTITDVLALTGAGKATIYRWMEKHPTLDEADAKSDLGHAFPKPVAKDGRTVLWNRAMVMCWWDDNMNTIGRHPKESATIEIPWSSYRKAMLIAPKTHYDDDQEILVDHMASISSTERNGDDVSLTFRNVSDAILFKLKYAESDDQTDGRSS